MYRKFFLNLLLLIVPLLILVLWVNIKVDCGFAINTRSTEIAKILVSGKNAGIKYPPSNFGSLQNEIVEEQLKSKKPAAKDILVFGTSRSSEINSAIFSQNSFFNCVVPGGNILDYIALYGLYKQNNLMPKYLIISIDPWTFHSRKLKKVNKQIQQDYDASKPLSVNKYLTDDFEKGLAYLNLKYPFPKSRGNQYLSFDNLVELFSPNYFQLNIRLLNSKMVISTEKENEPSYFIVRKDGGYSLAFQSGIDSVIVSRKSWKFVNDFKSKFFFSSDTATLYFEYFKTLMFALKKDKVIPIVFFPPVNPIVFDNLSSSMKVAIEDKVRSFCEQNRIIVIGSFNPHRYGYNCVGNFFIDEYHPVKSVVNKIFSYHQDNLKSIGITVSD